MLQNRGKEILGIFKMIDHKKAYMYRSHPWHGLPLGEEAPTLINCYVEMVPSDTVKYELDKETGILKVDRPQKYSSLCPTLYGLIPQTFAGERVASYCMRKIGRSGLVGDGDPLDICIFTDQPIVRGDIIIKAIPIGGFRLLDGDEVDDKIIAVMKDDLIYGAVNNIDKLPVGVLERLRHYFLTYKDEPERQHIKVEITQIYDKEEAHEIIRLSVLDYQSLLSL